MSISYLAKPPLRRNRPRNRCAEASPDAANVLAVVRRTQDAVRAGEAEILAQAVEWARLHEVGPDSPGIATWKGTPIPLAGEGAPLVSEFCLAEFAAAVGMKTEAGRRFIAHALELAHRLPLIYARVLSGDVPVWRARRIAEQRNVTIDRRRVGFQGTHRLSGELDIADAVDLDEALARGAEYLKEQGSTDSLDVRRSQALGRLARGESNRSELTLYVHLDPDDAHATLENGDTDKVTVKPVIDLGEKITSTGYQPSDRLREQVVLRDRICAHPYCTRRARHADLDHITAYDDGGETSSDNLASS